MTDFERLVRVITHPNYPALAETAEANADWHEAKRYWYLAAQEARRANASDLVVRYCENEDRCASHIPGQPK